MKYTISILLFFSIALAYGQEAEVEVGSVEQDTVEVEVPDSLEADFTPTGIRFGVDALGLGFSLADVNLSSTLFIADIDFHRYFLVLEYGRYERSRIGENSLYYTNGSFWRIGADVNFFKNDPDKSVFSVGLRYGSSSFEDNVTAIVPSLIYGDRQISYQNENLSADWFEVVLGLKVPVWKLWLGANMRMKLGIDSFDHLQFSPYEVPGYGLAAEKDYWEVNYYIMYRIGWGE